MFSARAKENLNGRDILQHPQGDGFSYSDGQSKIHFHWDYFHTRRTREIYRDQDKWFQASKQASKQSNKRYLLPFAWILFIFPLGQKNKANWERSQVIHYLVYLSLEICLFSFFFSILILGHLMIHFLHFISVVSESRLSRLIRSIFRKYKNEHIGLG